METLIREFNPREPDGLALEAGQLLVNELNLYEHTGLPLEGRRETFFRSLAEEGGEGYAIVATEGGLLAATTVLHIGRTGEPGSAEITAFAVVPELRRQGIGRILVRHVAEVAAGRGDAAVTAFTLDPAPYHRFGFHGTRPHVSGTPAEIIAACSYATVAVQRDKQTDVRILAADTAVG